MFGISSVPWIRTSAASHFEWTCSFSFLEISVAPLHAEARQSDVAKWNRRGSSQSPPSAGRLGAASLLPVLSWFLPRRRMAGHDGRKREVGGRIMDWRFSRYASHRGAGVFSADGSEGDGGRITHTYIHTARCMSLKEFPVYCGSRIPAQAMPVLSPHARV